MKEEKKDKIDLDCLKKIQEMYDTRDTLVELILSIEKHIDKVDIYPDRITLTFDEDTVIDTELLVKLSEVIHYDTFTVTYEVLDRSFLGGVMEYSTVRLQLTLEFNEDLKVLDDGDDN